VYFVGCFIKFLNKILLINYQLGALSICNILKSSLSSPLL